ncbi:uncharacterized protein LOC116679041 [Etheostoma spectabile]|uniref:uncharacterized protein LOC116679041 n=1 Tax=Etheostoma spectabile TaxID=54343 RepID=UPI0013AFDFC0|nr:uncharacterized protein LOC116679041 [Etheostoma spectabile]
MFSSFFKLISLLFYRNTSSSKNTDVISKSVLIKSGSPAIYQLKPKKEDIQPLRTKAVNIRSLKRMTLGKKNPNKINKTILLVGETGAGKSTLINALVNYALGVEWEDDVWFQIVEEEERSQVTSQKSDVIVYQIFGFEDKPLPYSLTIIDTPGYGSTDGIRQDDIISQRLFDLFHSDDGVHEIDAVGLVLKASVIRLNDRLRYIFDSVVSLFGKDLEKNIVALITHSDGVTPKNALEALKAAKIKCARNENNQPVHFLFNNCQDEDRTEDIRALKHADEITTEGLSQFTDLLGKNAPQKLEKTVGVLEERIKLTACIQNLQDRTELIDLKQTEIQQTQEALKKHEEEMKNNEKFTVEVDVVYKDKEPIDGGMWCFMFYEAATCCTVCEENCHYPGCTMAWKPGHCEVIKDGRCTSCTRKCPVSDHVKENWKYVNKTRKVQKTLEDVKAKYEKNKEESEKKESLLKTLQKEMETLEAKKTALVDEAYQHVVKLEQIALKVYAASTQDHLDFLIEKMKEKGDTEKKKKLEEMKSQIDNEEGIQAALCYGLSKLTSAGKAKQKN